MADREIRIRMYRIGFGECFLVTFPGPPVAHVLIDCGVHSRGNIGTIDAVVGDIAHETGGELSLLVATHAHQDHIFGFDHASEVFRDFTIREIWLPWTEKLGDPDAARLRGRTARLVGALQLHFAATDPSPEAQAALINVGARSNRTALDNLRTGFGTGATVEYIEGPDERLDVGGITGLSARILGPPRDEKFLEKTYVPVAERYRARGAGGEVVDVDDVQPFADHDVRPPDEGPAFGESERARLRDELAMSIESLAFVLEEGMNNTSVVAMFEYEGRALLFPGDAQYGSWRFWTDAVDAAQLLGRVDFYKVSHHGSWNATPRSVVESLTAGPLASMVSTQSEPWPSIPDPRLMKELSDQAEGRVARSDSIVVDGAPAGPQRRRAPKGFRTGEFWYDHFIEL